MIRLPGVLLVLLLAACTSAPSLLDTQVVHMTRDQMLKVDADIPADGYLSTSQPDAQVLDVAARAGYTTVIDFRGVEEDRGIDEKAEVEARGMRYIAFPIATTDDATWANAKALGDMLPSIDGPILMHCFSGNRSGAMLAMAAKLEGESSSDALAFGKRGGLTRWEPEITEILESSAVE